MLTFVLLDVFGTLLDTEGDVYLSPFSHLLLPLELDEQQKARAVRMIYTSCLPTMDEAAVKLEEMFSDRAIPASYRREAEAELHEHLRRFALVDGVPELLARLRAAGRRLALVSNLAAPYAQLIGQHGLDRMVDATICSFEVGVQKPEPQIFELAMDRIGAVPAETVMIGDDELNDCLPARSLGLAARGVTPGGQDGGASLHRALEWVLSMVGT